MRPPARCWPGCLSFRLRVGVLAGVILATLPDLDYVLVFWDRLAYLRHHRGVTHSIWAVPLFAWLGAAAGRWRGAEPGLSLCFGWE